MIEETTSTSKLKNRLRTEGILFKGFGHIPKFVMLDKDLSLEAKAIYAYFCSYVGGGECAFPSRKKILYDLKISKDKYYNHYNQLIEQGYITAEQQMTIDEKTKKPKLSYNIYTLVANPKKYIDSAESIHKTPEDKIGRVRNTGMKSLGYGTIAKAPMQDRSISLKAKGIYAYFCSFAGGNDNAFPDSENIMWHLNISKTTYYNHQIQLIKANYITVIQRKVKGKYSINDYYINETPNEELVELKRTPKNQDTDKSVENTTSDKCPENQDTHKIVLENKVFQQQQNQDTHNKPPHNPDTNNTNNNNTNSIYNKQSINQKEKSKKNESDRSKEKIATNKNEHYKNHPMTKKTAVKSYDIKNNKTTYKGMQSTLKSKHSVSSEDILVEKEELTKDNILQRIIAEKEIPLELCRNFRDAQKITDILTSHTKFTNERYQIAFEIFNAALSEMLSIRELRPYGERQLSNKDILNKINNNIDIGSTYAIFKGTLVEEIVDDFVKGTSKTEVQNFKGYMKTCIANGLDTYRMKFLKVIDNLLCVSQ